jgi:hypothetical protein
MLAMGAKFSIGDQLHPAGKIDTTTYDLIGTVYREMEKKEAWCRGATPVSDIGVLTPEEFHGTGPDEAPRTIPPAALGAVRMLTELALQSDIVEAHNDFSRYKLPVLPDEVPAAGTLAESTAIRGRRR